MAGPVFFDSVAEWSYTAGTTRPYALGGAVPGGRTLNEIVPDGDWGYYRIDDDGARWEVISARFDAPDSLEPLEYITTSADGSPVEWPTSGRRIIRMQPSYAVASGVSTAAEELFWLGVASGLTGDLGMLSDGVATEIVDAGISEIGTITVSDLGILSDIIAAVEVSLADEELFWLGIASGLTDDLGVFSDVVSEVIDAGIFQIGICVASDLGVLSDIIVPDDDIFWMSLELSGGDWGKMTEQTVNVMDAGVISNGATVSCLDLGEVL